MAKITVYRFAYVDSREARVVSPDFATLTAIAAIGAELLVGSGLEVDADLLDSNGIVQGSKIVLRQA